MLPVWLFSGSPKDQISKLLFDTNLVGSPLDGNSD